MDLTPVPFAVYGSNTYFDLGFWNVREDYDFDIVKADSLGIPLEGATFEVYDLTDNLIDTVTTDDSGIGTIVNLDYGEYYIVETVAPIDYQLDVRPIYFEWKGGVDDYIVVVNQLADGSKVQVTKTDHEDYLLEGAVFGLYDSTDTLIETLTTDDRGEAISSLLDYGDYYLVEQTAPTGHQLDSTPIPVTISVDAYIVEIDIVNYPDDYVLTGNVAITKTDLETGATLANATFEIYNSTDTLVETITTNASGVATSGQIPMGNYYATEIVAPTGYVLNSTQIPFTIDSDEPVTLTVTNDKPFVIGTVEVYFKHVDKKHELHNGYSYTDRVGADYMQWIKDRGIYQKTLKGFKFVKADYPTSQTLIDGKLTVTYWYDDPKEGEWTDVVLPATGETRPWKNYIVSVLCVTAAITVFVIFMIKRKMKLGDTESTETEE